MYIHIYIYYVYIYREREIEICVYVCVYIYIYTSNIVTVNYANIELCPAGAGGRPARLGAHGRGARGVRPRTGAQVCVCVYIYIYVHM